MIKKEFYKTRFDGVKLYRSYSDNGMQIQKVGTDELYEEAIDVENANYTYLETDIPVFVEGEEATEADYQAALRDMGVQV